MRVAVDGGGRRKSSRTSPSILDDEGIDSRSPPGGIGTAIDR